MEQAKNMEEKMSWQSAIKKAEGVKVKDNPELLKKVRRGQLKVLNTILGVNVSCVRWHGQYFDWVYSNKLAIFHYIIFMS